MPLVLGDFVFADMEIPERISGLGGKQAITSHKLLGGARVVDVMGRDDGDPAWSGRFRGANATERALELEAMRIAGEQPILSFGSFYYLVVIQSFDFVFERAYQILYSITLNVVTSLVAEATDTLDDLVTSDLDALSGYVDQYVGAV